jgi:hypothetical protein
MPRERRNPMFFSKPGISRLIAGFLLKGVMIAGRTPSNMNKVMSVFWYLFFL